MGPRKSTKSKATLKKTTTMSDTATAGQEFLKKVWGEDKLSRVNALLEARDKADGNADDETTTAPVAASSSTTPSATTTATTSSKAKTKLSKSRTMKTTAKEGKALVAGEVLGGTRSGTKRRQAAVNAKKALEEVSKATGKRKPALKRLGTMANTAREGKAFIKRASPKKTTGRKRTGGRKKKSN